MGIILNSDKEDRWLEYIQIELISWMEYLPASDTSESHAIIHFSGDETQGVPLSGIRADLVWKLVQQKITEEIEQKVMREP
ncbi:hypothetical protein IJ00_08200 [Calothrix sp. 336/3]|nr:hypothetical protein IJ00_08200 [Calothrix sp. 336/3]